jgi:hypothetical protein
MKKILITTLLLSFLVVGCTSPTQRPAERDLQVAAKQFGTITYDLAIRCKYNAMMNALHTIRTSSDPVVRENALIEMSDQYAEVEFLLIQAERAQGLLRSGREWVRAQRGIFTVLLEDAKQAKANVDAKQKPSKPTTTSLPAPD